MTSVNEEHKAILESYGITLKKELKTQATIQLYNKTEDTKIANSLYDRLIAGLSNKDRAAISSFPTKIFFGVELEFVGSRKSSDLENFNKEMSNLLGDKYYYNGNYNHNSGSTWVLGRDGSIDSFSRNIRNSYGYELSSAKLNLFNEKDIETLGKVIELIKTCLHGEINRTCGTHVHIGFKHDKVLRDDVINLLYTYSNMESKIFDPAVPGNRRRNRYCKKTQPSVRNKYQKLSSRYCVFNFNRECDNLHFEVRQLEGTLDLNTIISWARFQAYIIYDLIDNISNSSYRSKLSAMNIFDLLSYYNFNKDVISFFIERVIKFKSRTIQMYDAA